MFSKWIAAAMTLGATLAAAAGESPVAGPFTSGNLTVYLVHGPDRLGGHDYLTLAKGLSDKTVVVRDKRNVNELTIENVSDRDLFVQAGEIVKGGQQDRTISRDMIVPPHSGQIPIAANCVEHGRWTARAGESAHQFDSSTNMVAGKGVREANYANNQAGVWENVGKTQADLQRNAPAAVATTSPTSLELTVEDKDVGKAVDDYKAGIDKSAATVPSGAIGFVFAVNGQIRGGDVYASPALFALMYPKLLHAAAVEAFSEKGGKSCDPPSADAVEKLLDAVDAAKPEPQSMDPAAMERGINEAAGVVVVRQAASPAVRTEVVKKQTNTVTEFQTRDTATKADFLHRAYLMK